jgi:hypothetical protein
LTAELAAEQRTATKSPNYRMQHYSRLTLNSLMRISKAMPLKLPAHELLFETLTPDTTAVLGQYTSVEIKT